MEEKLYNYIKNNTGTTFQSIKNAGLYNIYPLHVPDGVMKDENVLVYNIVSDTITYNLHTYRIQLSIFSGDYINNKLIAHEIEDIFISKRYDTTNDFISTTVENTIGREYDTENGVYFSAVNIVVKTTRH